MIHLDHHASTPLDPDARAALLEALDVVGHPASVHGGGQAARARLERARAAVAVAVGARPEDVVFTSSGTEAIHGALRGLPTPARILTTPYEHPAVRAAVEVEQAHGVPCVGLPVRDGAVDLDALALGPGDRVVIGWVNHETGRVQPLDALAVAVRRAGADLVVDAAQALGKLPVDVASLGLAALAVSGGKVGALSGSGALVLGQGVRLRPWLPGPASEERGLRGGTPGVVAAVALGAACGAIPRRLAAVEGITELRNRLEAGLRKLGGVVNGAEGPRVGHALSVSFPGRRGAAMVAALDLMGVRVSQGPACATGAGEPAAVVRALYPDEPDRAASAVRLTLGPETTHADVDGALRAFELVLLRGLRGQSRPRRDVVGTLDRVEFTSTTRGDDS